MIASRRWTGLLPRTSSSRRFSRRARRLAASSRASPDESRNDSAPQVEHEAGWPRRLHPAHLLVERVRVLEVQLAAERYAHRAARKWLDGQPEASHPSLPLIRCAHGTRSAGDHTSRDGRRARRPRRRREHAQERLDDGRVELRARAREQLLAGGVVARARRGTARSAVIAS